MKRCAALVLTLLCAVVASSAQDRAAAWPEIARENKPWGYWWWLGSAVDKENITKELTRYRDAGMGGVHIIPIYGAKGWEEKYIPYLSEKWMEMLAHCVSEGQRLGMGIDMTTGTGWCFGGPNITPELANMRTGAKVHDLKAGGTLPKVDRMALLAIVANVEGKQIDLTAKVGADGRVDWKAPAACKVLVLTVTRARQGVKRPAPGGEGPMLNPFLHGAIETYLLRFQQTFDAYKGPKPRAMYHDSYEYFGNDWSPDLFAQFAQRRGYKLEDHLFEMFAGTGDTTARLKCDYRQTVSEMLLESFTEVWVGWCHKNGFITRDQAHGSPGNLLDLYGANDIPETEMFNTDREILVSKFASSAAHVMGRKLVSSETGTWLAEHFHETLGDMKGLLDDLFVSGVNHIVYHGTIYSPDECPWPGFLFYASTQMNPRNSIWRDVPALNLYAARCQAVLQSGRPANDVLVYWPIHDLWHDEKGTAQGLTVHHRDWLLKQRIGEVAKKLWQRGWQFDYVSDRQLVKHTDFEALRITVPAGNYATILVPRCTRMPVETLKKLIDLADEGATILFDTDLPNDVPGLADLENQRAALKGLLTKIQLKPLANTSLKQAAVGTGRILMGDVEAALAMTGAQREPMMEIAGVKMIRRYGPRCCDYFVANHGEARIDQWLPLATARQRNGNPLSILLMDPMTGRIGIAATRPGEAYVQLDPGQSIIVRVTTFENLDAPKWTYRKLSGDAMTIGRPWDVKFLSGGPALPKPFKTDQLESWTKQADPEAQRFAGTGIYATTFDTPAAGRYRLNLGKVCQSARVRLNGKDLGTLFTPPFAIDVDLNDKANILEVEVTNVSANRLRDLDIRGVQWKIFRDINIVNINYKPLDASKWPLTDSGLLGPVTIQRVEAMEK